MTVAADLAPGETLDGALGGAVRLIQRRAGYRFSLDAVLLADFALPASGQALDLGTGCGVIPLVMAHRAPGLQLTAVELQPSLASLAQRNVLLNGRQSQVSVVQADLRAFGATFATRRFDLVLSNPPYQPVLGGRPNPDAERAVARHELRATLVDVVACARALLEPPGRLAMVYPMRRWSDLAAALEVAGFALTRVRHVHPRAEEPAKLVLVEARLTRGRGPPAPVERLPPLALHLAGRTFTEEARRILGEA